jgi:hypothetical protein
MDEIRIPEIGDWVAWPWLSGMVEGKVVEVVPHKHQIISKGSLITRKGTAENPAVVMEHKSGNPVIKLASELTCTN